MKGETCCTCASLLAHIDPRYDEKTEKPVAHDRQLTCCGRVICGSCIASNSRFATYCPFCQVTEGASLLPQGLYDPPEYSPPTSVHALSDRPPAYSATTSTNIGPVEKDGSAIAAEDVLHFIDPSKDTIPSIGLRYGVPQDALRRRNGLFADHLLAARKTILIPGEFYKGGVSLSPQPIDGEEEEIRKAKIRRFMVSCKVSDYDVAVLYLQQAGQDLDMAVEAFLADEKWEKEHPIEGSSSKAKGQKKSAARRYGLGGGLSGQI